MEEVYREAQLALMRVTAASGYRVEELGMRVRKAVSEEGKYVG